MRRMLYESRLVSRRAKDLERLLLKRTSELLAHAADGPAMPDPDALDGAFLIDLPLHWAGMDLAKRVRVRTGVVRRMGERVLLPLSWEAAPGHLLFPSFEGTLELETMRANVTELTLAGSYRVPLGMLGGVMDATVLHNAARDTARRLIDGAAAAMEQQLPARPAPVSERTAASPLTVGDVMTPDPLVAPASLGLRAAARLLFSSNISAVPVVADDGGLVGVLSEHDLLAKEARQRYGFGRKQREDEQRRQAVSAEEACAQPALTTTPDTLLADAARALLDHDVSRLVVVRDAAVVGIVTRHDMLRALVRDLDDIEAGVREALHQVGADDLAFEIDLDGQVALSGETELRSVAARAGDVVREVEGVMAVSSGDVRWRDDDVLPLAGPI